MHASRQVLGGANRALFATNQRAKHWYRSLLGRPSYVIAARSRTASGASSLTASTPTCRPVLQDRITWATFGRVRATPTSRHLVGKPLGELVLRCSALASQRHRPLPLTRSLRKRLSRRRPIPRAFSNRLCNDRPATILLAHQFYSHRPPTSMPCRLHQAV